MADVVVKDDNKDMVAIIKNISRFKKSSIYVGFQEGSVTTQEVKGQRVKEGGQSMAEIASANEFGAKGVPARPFMATSFDENIKGISRKIRSEYNQVLDGKDYIQALDGIGVYVVGLIQKKITQIKTPPNSPETIKLKGSSNPLIDFGQMRQSVTYQIKK